MANQQTAAAPKKKGFFARLGEYFKGVKYELGKVTWPSKKETGKYTAVVIVVCLAFALLFWILDTGILALLELVM